MDNRFSSSRINEIKMQEFLDALSKFSPAQLLTSLAVLTPFVAGIWVAMKWAYATRFKNLEATLADFRTDFERKLARELAKVTDSDEERIRALKVELDATLAKSAAGEAKLARVNDDLQATKSTLELRSEALANAEHGLAAFLNDTGVLTELSPRVLTYLCENPMLISKLLFTRDHVSVLHLQAQEGQGNAMYLYGRMLVSGRGLRDGNLPQDKERGLTLIRAAAEKGHQSARSFSL